MKTFIAVLCGLLVVAPAFAIDRDKAFDDPELQARYEEIIDEVRCVQCQNQTIKDSNALIANDLRREIRTPVPGKLRQNILSTSLLSNLKIDRLHNKNPDANLQDNPCEHAGQ